MAEVTSKKKWYLRWWAITLYVLVFFSIVGSMSGNKTDSNNQANQTQPTANTASETTPVPVETIKISAVKLSEEYDANKVAADAKYKDKYVEVSGIVDSIGKDILDDPYVTLQGRTISFFGVQCMFPRSDESKLATLSKGQSLTLQGKVSGEIIGNVLVRGCSIVQ